VDGREIGIGESVTFGSFAITVKTSHLVLVSTEHFEFDLTNSDMFINQAVRSKVPVSRLESHGLLGQTHSPKIYPTSLRYIDGTVDDYAISDNDIFGADFVFNQFRT